MKWLAVPVILLSLGALYYYFDFKTVYIKEETATSTQEEVESEITVTFAGDMMFDRYVRAKNHGSGYLDLFSDDLVTKLNQSDFVVANLEGSITSLNSVSKYDIGDADHFRFTFAPEVINLLKKANIQGVSIGNNHILNFGREGLTETKELLEKAGIGYFGDPFNSRNVWVTEIEGITFAFIAESEFDDISPEETERVIEEYDRKVDHVVVIPHWGSEYETEESSTQREMAHSYIKYGADLIIGAHPHVIQGNENYRGKYIYYSLGNFVFDQYFSSDVKCGKLVTFTFSKDSITLLEEDSIELVEAGAKTKLSSCGITRELND